MSQKTKATHSVNSVTTSAVTPWFPGEVNPVHIGLYQVVVGDSLALTLFPRGNFLHWDGLAWRAPARNLIIQMGNPYVLEVPLGAIIRWRGLAKDPNEAVITIIKDPEYWKKRCNELEFINKFVHQYHLGINAGLARECAELKSKLALKNGAANLRKSLFDLRFGL
jgi:hypothetical protein